MDKVFDIPQRSQLVVASDVHIRTPNDSRALALMSLIDQSIKAEVKIFVLNGDIFDFFFGWGAYFKTRYKNIFSRLEQLALTGCKVIFVEGNHEFGLDKMSTKGVRFIDSFGEVIDVDGTQILIVHGDLMKHDWKYLAYRSVVRSKLANILAAAISQKLFDKFTLWLASTSRKKDHYRTLNHQSILTHAKALLNQSNAQHMIFGHFHHPYDETTEHGQRILSVDSWDKPSCLVMNNGKFTRLRPTSD